MNARLLGVLTIASLASPGGPIPARTGEHAIRHEAASPSGKAAVVVSGIDRENLAKLSGNDWNADRWAEVLSVAVASADGKALPIAGTYRVVGDSLRFEPSFPIDPGLRHVATFDPSRLPIARPGGSERIEFERPAAPRPEPSSVSRVEPSGAVLPENLLKFYVHFSAPMSRGEVYDRVRLVDASGRTIEGAFLEIGEELWDPSGTRIMLLLDPGRIKRGLRPREEDGPILEAGKTYTLRVDREWPDASGQPMRKPFEATFRAGPADMAQPDPKTWEIEPPDASSRDPLTLKFPEPLDRAMLDRALVLRDPKGEKVAGVATVEAGSSGWRFTPSGAWSPGDHTLEVDPELEDLAGNSIARPFEVDAEGITQPPRTTQAVQIRITISARRP